MRRLPSPWFLVPLIAAGIFGAITGRTVARVSCVVGEGPPGSGCPGAEVVAAIGGAVIAMVGVAVVVALALLSLAEWRETQERAATRNADPSEPPPPDPKGPGTC